MGARALLRVLAPGAAAVLVGTAGHLVWGETTATLISAGIGAVAVAVFAPRPETERLSQPPIHLPTETLPLKRGLPPGIGQFLLEHLPMGVVLVDGQGRVRFINPAAIELFGRRPPGDFHAAALRAPKLLDAIETSLAEGLSSTVNFTLSRRDEIHLRGHVRPLADGTAETRNPEDFAVLVVIEDQTQLRRAEELHRDFVANASHELKTPLSSIAGIIETLQGHARDDPDAADRFLKIMGVQSERMRRLVDDLISLNRIEINERVLPRRPQRLCDIVGETAEVMQPIARAAEMTLEAELPPEELIVLGSREELAQVFQNLIDNAIKYGRSGGRVALACLLEDPAHPRMVGIAVSDDGPGIAREHLPRLTERFYRVSVSRSRARGGTGLGLAIVKHVLNRHRGRLEIDSTPGEGSRFTVWLPIAASSAVDADARAGVSGGTL